MHDTQGVPLNRVVTLRQIHLGKTKYELTHVISIGFDNQVPIYLLYQY